MSEPNISIEEQAEAFKALKQGEWQKVQRWNRIHNCWRAGTEDMSRHYDLETILRLKPSPKLRPWKIEEVPVGAIVRVKGTESRYIINGACGASSKVYVADCWTSLEQLFCGYEMNDRSACGVLEVPND